MKFNSTVLSRETKSAYDGSANDERGYFSDNSLYILQTGLHYQNQNSESEYKIHYHNYDRKYDEQGTVNKYYSESLTTKAESDMTFNDNLSFGYGADYKYDWGDYTTLTFTSQTKGHLKNFGIFSNAGYKFNDKQSLSLHLRNDDHKETGANQTYKINNCL